MLDHGTGHELEARPASDACLCPGGVFGIAVFAEGVLFPKLAPEGAGDGGKEPGVDLFRIVGALVVVGHDEARIGAGNLPAKHGVGVVSKDWKKQLFEPVIGLRNGIGIEQHDDGMVGLRNCFVEHLAGLVFLRQDLAQGDGMGAKLVDRAIGGAGVYREEVEVAEGLPPQHGERGT